MRRWARTIIVFLFLGAIVNIALCYVTVLRPLERWTGKQMARGGGASLIISPADGKVLLVSDYAGFGWLSVRTTLWESVVDTDLQRDYGMPLNPTALTAGIFNHDDAFKASYFHAWRSFNLCTSDRLATRFDEMLQDGFGWPLLAMMYEIVPAKKESLAHSPYSVGSKLELRGGILLDQDMGVDGQHQAHRSQALPLRFLWSGFASNTVLYALVLWLICAAPLALRRRLHHRRRRGQCAACGYPIGTSTVCTECGAAVART